MGGVWARIMASVSVVMQRAIVVVKLLGKPGYEDLLDGGFFEL